MAKRFLLHHRQSENNFWLIHFVSSTHKIAAEKTLSFSVCTKLQRICFFFIFIKVHSIEHAMIFLVQILHFMTVYFVHSFISRCSRNDYNVFHVIIFSFHRVLLDFAGFFFRFAFKRMICHKAHKVNIQTQAKRRKRHSSVAQ